MEIDCSNVVVETRSTVFARYARPGAIHTSAAAAVPAEPGGPVTATRYSLLPAHGIVFTGMLDNIAGAGRVSR